MCLLRDHAASEKSAFRAENVQKGEGVGTRTMTFTRLFYRLAVFVSWWHALVATSDALHQARFARDHEVTDLTAASLPTDSLLLGITHFSRILQVKATPQRRELGELLIQAPTGGGKGLFAVSQLFA